MVYTCKIDAVDSNELHQALTTDGLVVVKTEQQVNKLREVHNKDQFLNRQSNSDNQARSQQKLTDQLNNTVKGMLYKKFDDVCLSRGVWLNYYRLGRNETVTVLNHFDSKTVIDGECVVVTVGPALALQTKSMYTIPKLQTKVKPQAQREPRTDEEQRTELINIFEAIDGALMYYQATANASVGIAFEVLQQRTKGFGNCLTADDFEKIMTVFPHCYDVDENQKISAPGLPESAQYRKETFTQFVNQTKFPIHIASTTITNAKGSRKRSLLASDRYESLRKKPANASMKAVEPSGSLLDRIKAKQQQKFAQADLTKQKYNLFIQAQIKKVSAVLLSMQSKSYSLEHVLTILNDSLQQRLSKNESTDVIKAIADKLPEFCEMVNIGNIRAVKIAGGWTANQVSQKLQCC